MATVPLGNTPVSCHGLPGPGAGHHRASRHFREPCPTRRVPGLLWRIARVDVWHPVSSVDILVLAPPRNHHPPRDAGLGRERMAAGAVLDLEARTADRAVLTALAFLLGRRRLPGWLLTVLLMAA